MRQIINAFVSLELFFLNTLEIKSQKIPKKKPPKILCLIIQNNS